MTVKKQLVAIVMAASIAGGVGVGATVGMLTSDDPVRARPSTTTPRASASPRGVEVKDPVLVLNSDGGATLSATLINHTTIALDLEDATGGKKNDTDAPFLLAWGSRSKIPLKPGASMLIGNVASDYRIRFADRVQVGSTLPVTISFHYHGLMTDGAPSTTVYAPVVSRTAKYAGVANNGPNNAITVHGAQIVLVPGQDRAYIGGWTTSTIEDIAYTLPTATTTKGFPVSYRHQTATGGGYALAAFPGKKMSLGGPPYLDDGGDRDYFLASEIRVGQTIKVTIRFPSGDVVARFKVIQGKADGTV